MEELGPGGLGERVKTGLENALEFVRPQRINPHLRVRDRYSLGSSYVPYFLQSTSEPGQVVENPDPLSTLTVTLPLFDPVAGLTESQLRASLTLQDPFEVIDND